MPTSDPPPAQPQHSYPTGPGEPAEPMLPADVRAAANIALAVAHAVQQHGAVVDDPDGFFQRVLASALGEIGTYDAALVAAGERVMPDRVRLAAPGGIRAWLDAPASPGAQESLASRLRCDATWHAGAASLRQVLYWLIRCAQEDDILGVPDHEIRLWTGGDADPDWHRDGLYLTIRQPVGPLLLSRWLDAAALVGSGHGPDAAVQALTGIAAAVDRTLTEQDMAILAVHRYLSRTAAGVVYARAFPFVSTPPTPHPDPAPPPLDAAAPARRQRH